MRKPITKQYGLMDKGLMTIKEFAGTTPKSLKTTSACAFKAHTLICRRCSRRRSR